MRWLEVRVLGAESAEVAHEPVELNASGGPQLELCGPDVTCERHGLRDEAGATRYLSVESGLGRQEYVPKLMLVGEDSSGTNWSTAFANGSRWPDNRGARGENF